MRTLARDADAPAFAIETVPEEVFAFGRLRDECRNVLLTMLTNPRTRRLFGSSWADEARRMVAQFRASHDMWAGDPASFQANDDPALKLVIYTPV